MTDDNVPKGHKWDERQQDWVPEIRTVEVPEDALVTILHAANTRARDTESLTTAAHIMQAVAQVQEVLNAEARREAENKSSEPYVTQTPEEAHRAASPASRSEETPRYGHGEGDIVHDDEPQITGEEAQEEVVEIAPTKAALDDAGKFTIPSDRIPCGIRKPGTDTACQRAANHGGRHYANIGMNHPLVSWDDPNPSSEEIDDILNVKRQVPKERTHYGIARLEGSAHSGVVGVTARFCTGCGALVGSLERHDEWCPARVQTKTRCGALLGDHFDHPCVLPAGHDEPAHKDRTGFEWEVR